MIPMLQAVLLCIGLFMIFLLLGIFIYVIKSNGDLLPPDWRLTSGELKQYTGEFYIYSHPLFIYSLVGMIIAIFDRWLLQLFGGSIEQGFFGLSYQIGAICFVFSSAMALLIMREFAIAYNNKDMRLMANLFRRYIPLLYSATAFIACFMAVNAAKVTMIMGGGRFTGATLAVAVMALYPIHQTYGQLSSSVFMATGQTALYRNIGVAFMLVGLPITFLLIAPKHLFGMNAGAFGLAVKMVSVQFLWVNTHLYFNAKLLHISFWKYIAHQLASVACLLAVAVGATFFVDTLMAMWIGRNMVFNFMTAGAVYTAAVFSIVYFFPILFGLSRVDIQRFRDSAVYRVQKIFNM